MKNRKNLIWLGVMALLLGWTAYTVFSQQTPGQLFQAIARADWRFLLAGLALTAAFIGCEAKTSHIILRALGSPQPFRRCCFYSCAGFFFSNITPSATGGQPAQIYYMGKDGSPVVHGAIDMLLVTIGYHTATAVFGILALATCPDLPERLGGQVGLLLGLGFAIFVALDAAMILFLFLPGPARRLGSWAIRAAVRARPSLDQAGLEEKLEEELARYAQGARLIRSAPGLLPRMLALAACQLACSYAVPYVVFLAFHLTGVSFWEVFCLQVLCTIAVGYLPLPGSTGAAENVFLRAFVLIFGSGLVAPAMILSRMLSCYLALIVTGVLVAVVHVRRRPDRGGSGEAAEIHDIAA